MKQLLHGLKVLELGQFIRVLYCCKILSDFGAEIIKEKLLGWEMYLEDMAHFQKTPLIKNAVASSCI